MRGSGLLGSAMPRIYTPALRELTPDTSRGFEAVEFAEKILGVELYPWQRWLLVRALELRPDGETYRFRTVIVLVARQNGKTLLMTILALWRMYIDGARMVIGTAQNLDIAEKAWGEAVEMADAVEELRAEIERVDKGSGKKALRLRTKETYKVAAASRRGARGLTGDLVLLDELREHQSWDSWGASTKTTLARPAAQVWGLSNAGDAASIVLRHLRTVALRSAVGVQPADLGEIPDMRPPDEDDVPPEDSLGIFEWSAPAGCLVSDRSGWALANPSLGQSDYSISERAIGAALETDPEWVFRTEVLCQWRSTASGGPFPDGAWSDGIDAGSRAGDGPVAVGVDVSADGGMAYVAVAAERADGHIHCEVVTRRAGTEWLIPWLTSPERESRPRWAAVAWQINGAPVSALTDDLRATGLPVDAAWSGPELSRASGVVAELVRLPGPVEPFKRRLFHPPQPAVDVPASTAVVRTLGDSWVLDRRRSPVDVAPLVAVFAAVWALTRPETAPAREPQVHEWPADIFN